MLQILSFKNRKESRVFSLLMLLFSLSISAQCTLTGWKTVAQGGNFTVALKEDGSLWLWGHNNSGISGNGTGQTTEIKHPWKMSEVGDGWTDVQAGRAFILAKKANGDLYGWGANNYGQLGLGHNNNVSAPTLIQTNVASFSAGYLHTLVVKTNGTLWGAGYNDWSGLGVGTSVGSYNTFQQESSNATNWATVTATYYNSFAIKTNGTLWSAGTNIEGQTGLGTPASLGTNETAVFTQVGTDTNWKAVVGGIYHTLGLKTNGELWSWGHNNNGRLGLGTTGSIFYTPQQVPGTTWAAIGATNEASSALKSDGSLWTWGYNSNGKLGIGTTTDVNIPTKVGTENNWKSIPIRSGEESSAGIKNDTSLFSWGWDGYWQLGNNDGTQTNTSVPTQVTCTDLQLAVNDISSQNKVTLYPNPAKDFVYIKSQEKLDEVKIYSLTGVLIKATRVENGAVKISDLPTGTYILKTDNNEVKDLKFIKK